MGCHGGDPFTERRQTSSGARQIFERKEGRRALCSLPLNENTTVALAADHRSPIQP
jgi:hypothetical protein